jgi:hypothetical protein
MMQQVNLYQPTARKLWKLFSIQMTSSIALAMMILLFAVYYSGYQDQQKLRVNLQNAKLQEEDQLKRIEKLQVKLYPKTKSQQMAQKLDLLKAERRQKTRVLSRLQDQTISNAAGFSNYFEGLARQRMAELWLTRIRIQEGGEQLFLDGRSLQANLVPEYLQRLSREKAFGGRVFQTFSLVRADEQAGHLDFSIGTKDEEDKPKK